MIWKRSLALFLACAFACGILSACMPVPSTSQQTQETTRKVDRILSFRITWKDYSGRGEAIQQIVDAYNQQNDSGCLVSMVGGDEDRATLQNMLLNDSKTILVLPYRYVKYFGNKKLLVDLTSQFEADQSLFYPEIWNLCTLDNKVYGVPWLGHSMCLLYNKSLLEKAGIDPSSINSIESFQNALQVIEARTSAKGIGLVGKESNDVSWMVNQFIYGFGSTLVSDNGEKVTVNNEKARDALYYYRDVLGQHAQPTWVDDTGTEVMDAFRKQEVAFEIQGIWGVTDIIKNGSPFEVGIKPLSDLGLCSEVGPMMVAIPASMPGSLQAEAVRFIQYLISKPAQEQIMNGEYDAEQDTYYPFRTPIRVDMANSNYFTVNPEYLTFVAGFRNPSIDVPVPAWQTIKEQVYQPGLHQVMQSQLSVEDFLVQVETKGNEILTSATAQVSP